RLLHKERHPGLDRSPLRPAMGKRRQQDVHTVQLLILEHDLRIRERLRSIVRRQSLGLLRDHVTESRDLHIRKGRQSPQVRLRHSSASDKPYSNFLPWHIALPSSPPIDDRNSLRPYA